MWIPLEIKPTTITGITPNKKSEDHLQGSIAHCPGQLNLWVGQVDFGKIFISIVYDVFWKILTFLSLASLNILEMESSVLTWNICICVWYSGCQRSLSSSDLEVLKYLGGSIISQYNKKHKKTPRNSTLFNLYQKFLPRGSVANKSALVQVTAWCQTGDKPLPDPIITNIYGLWHTTSLGHNGSPVECHGDSAMFLMLTDIQCSHTFTIKKLSMWTHWPLGDLNAILDQKFSIEL